MTRAERNRRISELREPLATWDNRDMPWDGPAYLSDGGCWFGQREFTDNSNPDWEGPVMVPNPSPTDWDVDANFPTLLRELVDASDYSEGVTMWVRHNDSHDGSSVYGVDLEGVMTQESSSLADAVCEAWLRWKQGPGGEA